MEEPMKGVMKEPTVVTSRAAVRLDALFTSVPVCLVCMNL